MKFGQSVEYKMRNNFLEKSSTKCGRETSPMPFFKKSKMRISLDQQYILLLLYVLVEDDRSILKLRC